MQGSITPAIFYRVILSISLLIPTTLVAQVTQAPIVVTATRSAQTVDESLAPVTVITRTDIEARQPQDLSDLLRLEAGIDVVRSGGPGQQASLFMRGTNSNHVLVLIDGVRASSATTGAFAWNSLSVSQIERIEIVRGPRASLYGSEAIGGVIQIFTRTPSAASVRVEGGSFGSKALQAGWGSSAGPSAFNINIEKKESDGFSAQNSAGFSFDPDKDGYDTNSLTVGYRWQQGAHGLELSGWHSEGDTDFDIGTLDNSNQTLGMAYHHEGQGMWQQSLRLGLSRDELETQAAFPSDISTRRRMAEWLHHLSIDDTSLLTLGLSHVHDEGKNIDTATTTTIFDSAIDDNALFAHWQSRLLGSDVELGLRHDQHSDFGHHTTGQLGWGYDLGKDTRVIASYGTAFRSPTLTELYHPGFGGLFAGNPNIEPESSQSAEIGMRFRLGKHHRLGVNAYDTQIEDLIAYQGINFQAINLNKARVTALEIEHDSHYRSWRFQTNITLQRARDEEANQDLLRRPDQKLTLQIQRHFASKGHIGAEMLLSSQRLDIGGVKLPGYGVANIHFAYDLTKQLSLEGRIDNLLDKQYQLAHGFNTSDRAAYVALRYDQ